MSEPLTSSGPAQKPARPFPWTCPKCRRKEVRRVTMPYECQRLYNGQPITVVLENFSVPRCNNCGELIFDYEAEEQIKRAYEAQTSRLSKPLAPESPFEGLAKIIHGLVFLAAEARRSGAVSIERINVLTAPWDECEKLIRATSVNRGIPFAVFDDALREGRAICDELVQVTAGNDSIPFDFLDSRYTAAETRLKQLAATWSSLECGTAENNQREGNERASTLRELWKWVMVRNIIPSRFAPTDPLMGVCVGEFVRAEGPLTYENYEKRPWIRYHSRLRFGVEVETEEGFQKLRDWVCAAKRISSDEADRLPLEKVLEMLEAPAPGAGPTRSDQGDRQFIPGKPDTLGAALDPILRSNATPSLEMFLDLGRELNKARLYDFIDEAIRGGELAKSTARGLLSAVTRRHDPRLDAETHARVDDEGHARGLLADIQQYGRWLYVRDELIKFSKLVDEELAKRSILPSQAEDAGSYGESVQATIPMGIAGSTESCQPPKAFISYSWDNEEHKLWTRDLAARLRADGIDVTLDRWAAVPGDQLPSFMETAIRENSYVLIVCTPNYKEKSDKRTGGVGYEGDIMTGEVHTTGNHRKFIPILRGADWNTSLPSWLAGKYGIDLIGTPYCEQEYQNLLRTLHNMREQAPPIGPAPQARPIPEEAKKIATKREVDEERPSRHELTWVTEENLRELPRRAMVALAARCARRVQPLYELPAGLPERQKHVEAIENAIQVAELFAKGTVPAATWAPADAAQRPACVADANAAFSAATNLEVAATAAAAIFQTVFAAWAAGTANESEAVSRTLAAIQTAETTDTRAAFALGGNALLPSAIVVRAAACTDLQKLLNLNLGKFPNLGSAIDPGENGPLGPLWPERQPDWYQHALDRSKAATGR